jgi:hypothetical protein
MKMIAAFQKESACAGFSISLMVLLPLGYITYQLTRFYYENWASISFIIKLFQSSTLY